MIIRKALPNEAETLTQISVRSESYWQNDEAYMRQFEVLYKVTADFIRENPVFVLEDCDELLGFYAIVPKESSLEYLFIEPKYIGKGYGKQLWRHAVKTGKALKMKRFQIVTSPQAKGFYEKLGAKFTGETESLVRKGRIIPQFVYSLWEQPDQ